MKKINFAIGLLCLSAAIAGAQTVKQQTDSIRRETCRGGTLSSSGLSCSGATASVRVTVIRRLANRIDSLVAATGSTPNALWSTTPLFRPEDTGTVAACIHVTNTAGRSYVAYPVLWINAGVDSGPLPAVNGLSIRDVCSAAFTRAGKPFPTDSIRVDWYATWMQFGGARLWRPYAVVP